MKKIPIALTRNYVCDWSVEDAARELIQNALDAGDYEIEIDKGLHINSYNGTIPEQYLLLGEGGKSRGGATRGGFNEGMTLALLIFARESYNVQVKNGNKIWIPSLEYSDLYSQECLHITILDGDPDGSGVEIYIEDLDAYITQNVKDNTLQMQEAYEKFDTNYGEILLEEKHGGRIYVGGLFICDYDKSKYGFNFNPEDFPLDRDRKSVSEFDIQWITRTMWEQMIYHEEAAEEVLDSIVTRDPSIKYTDVSGTSGKLKELTEELYNEKYSGKLIVADVDEYEDLKEAGNKVELVTNEKLVNIIHQTEGYKTFKLSCNEVVKVTAVDLIYEFKEKWGDSMSTDMYYDFEDMEQKLNKFI